jgi:hypothetical protein
MKDIVINSIGTTIIMTNTAINNTVVNIRCFHIGGQERMTLWAEAIGSFSK